MEARAEARYVRISPQKARLVIDLIRGLRVDHALSVLRSANKGIAPAVEKLVRSAVANAENRSADVDVDKLIVSEAYVNEGGSPPRLWGIRRRHCRIVGQPLRFTPTPVGNTTPRGPLTPTPSITTR